MKLGEWHRRFDVAISNYGPSDELSEGGLSASWPWLTAGNLNCEKAKPWIRGGGNYCNSAMYVLICLLCAYVHLSVEYLFRSGIDGSYGIQMLTFSRFCRVVAKRDCINLESLQNCIQDLVLLHAYQHLVLPTLTISVILLCVCGLISWYQFSFPLMSEYLFIFCELCFEVSCP